MKRKVVKVRRRESVTPCDLNVRKPLLCVCDKLTNHIVVNTLLCNVCGVENRKCGSAEYSQSAKPERRIASKAWKCEYANTIFRFYDSQPEQGLLARKGPALRQLHGLGNRIGDRTVQLLHRVIGQVGIARSCLRIGMPQELADHGQRGA